MNSIKIEKEYNFNKNDKIIYNYWEKKKYFNSLPDNRSSYVVLMPPPNITGVLHMGHILNNTIQDVLTRKARLEGLNTCWVPGLDHASIATEHKIITELKKKKGISKEKIGIQRFLKLATKWKLKYSQTIIKQLKKIGCSCDWQRLKFSLDDNFSQAVNKIFLTLYHSGYLYKKYGIVNWDTKTKTALSNEEIKSNLVRVKLYYIKYHIKNDTNYILVATRRPETIFADTALCVNPTDKRYLKYLNKKVIVPISSKEIPIIADNYVDPKFGSGCVKITPAHDYNDKLIAERHNLEIINLIDTNGTLNKYGLYLYGKSVKDARIKVLSFLRVKNYLVKIKEYNSPIGYSERSNTEVEQLLSYQWFLKMNLLVKKALHNITQKDLIKLYPKKIKNKIKDWFINIKDWNISRQLWWGHRIPSVMTKVTERIITEFGPPNINTNLTKDIPNSITKNSNRKINNNLTKEITKSLNKNINRNIKKSSKKDTNKKDNQTDKIDQVKVDDKNDKKIDDKNDKKVDDKNDKKVDDKNDKKVEVLDTWFSAWIWPIVIFNGIMNKNNYELQYYYPITELVTGDDILFFWVIRMILAGLFFIKQKPFHNIYFNGIVKDSNRLKMSKSLGNSPNINQIFNKYGADSVRCGILIMAPIGKDMVFNTETFLIGNKIKNKIWNAFKLIVTFNITQNINQKHIEINNYILSWIKNKFFLLVKLINKLFKKYKLSKVLIIIYNFFKKDFCSLFLESTKRINSYKLTYSFLKQISKLFRNILIIFHPFIPFITEYIWSILKIKNNIFHNKKPLLIQKWPTEKKLNINILNEFKIINKIILQIRKFRSIYKNYNKITLLVFGNQPFNNNKKHLLIFLCKIKDIQFLPLKYININTSKEDYTFILYDEIYFIKNTTSIVDIKNMTKELEYYKNYLNKIILKLKTSSFLKKAPKKIIKLEQKKKMYCLNKIKLLKCKLTEIKLENN